jgi:hypothetical protein
MTNMREGSSQRGSYCYCTGDNYVFEDVHTAVNLSTQNMDTIFQRSLESRRLSNEDKTLDRLA